jgi:hypothetical protein
MLPYILYLIAEAAFLVGIDLGLSAASRNRRAVR